ncbi:UNVERIFIED_CONTAM: hypothetical protein Sradi_7257400 [Sesamum radiatum]|uniref:Uncharacterized protein n=1 Tax=Sesamum radiatum TaxID=300843 RepID=A0AAW2IJS6_SESRA
MVISRNVEEETRVTLGQVFGISVVAKHEKYLGLPMGSGRSKKEMFEAIKSKLGSSPSYTWRPLWGTRDVLATGFRWKVRDGYSILIVGHLWIPRLDLFQLIRRPATLPPDSRVPALLTSDRGLNIELIETEFYSLDTKSILGIKIHEGERDSLQLWTLGRRGVLHVLFQCSLARLVWASSGLEWVTIECSWTSTEDWFGEVHWQLSLWEWDLFLAICWSIWRNRNQLVFEGRRVEAHEICFQAKSGRGTCSSSGHDRFSRSLVKTMEIVLDRTLLVDFG